MREHLGLLLFTVLSVLVIARYLARPGAGFDGQRVSWSGLDAIVFFACLFLSQFAALLVGVLTTRWAFRELLDHAALDLPHWGLRPGTSPVVFQLFYPAFAAIAFVIGLAVVAPRAGGVGGALTALGFRRAPGALEGSWLLALGAAVLIPMVVLGGVWKAVLDAVGLDTTSQRPVLDFAEALARGDVFSIGVFVVAAVVVAPVVEEIVFRGLLYGSLRRSLGAGAATVFASVTFAVIHGNLLAFLPIFLLSLVLCIVYEKRGSVFDPMIVHAVFNGGSLTAMAYQDDLRQLAPPGLWWL